MDCYIWYSEEGTGRGRSPPRPLLAVPNVTVHPSTVSVPITALLYSSPLLYGFTVPIKGLKQLYNSWTTYRCSYEKQPNLVAASLHVGFHTRTSLVSDLTHGLATGIVFTCRYSHTLGLSDTGSQPCYILQTNTSSPAVAERPRDASCLSVASIVR